MKLDPCYFPSCFFSWASTEIDIVSGEADRTHLIFQEAKFNAPQAGEPLELYDSGVKSYQSTCWEYCAVGKAN